MSIFCPFEVMKRNPLQWVYSSPIVFLPVIDGRRIKSFNVKGCLDSFMFSEARCVSSSLASADLWVIESYYLRSFRASFRSPCTKCRLLLPSWHLNVISLIKDKAWCDLGSKISLDTYVGLWRLIRRWVVCFSIYKEQFFIVRMWRGRYSVLC